MIQQAFVSEAFHPDDTIREIWADLTGRAIKKARTLGGVFAEPGAWSVSPPLDDDDFCYHVRLQFSLVVPDPPRRCACWCDGAYHDPVKGYPLDECDGRCCGDDPRPVSNVVRGDE